MSIQATLIFWLVIQRSQHVLIWWWRL